MSKIDDFFHKNLSNYEEADDQWNVPDDHVWNQAQLEFPQEKKKRRGFFWIWGGAGLLLIALLSYTAYNKQLSDQHPVAQVESEIAAQITSDQQVVNPPIDASSNAGSMDDTDLLIDKQIVKSDLNNSQSSATISVNNSTALSSTASASQTDDAEEFTLSNGTKSQSLILAGAPSSIEEESTNSKPIIAGDSEAEMSGIIQTENLQELISEDQSANTPIVESKIESNLLDNALLALNAINPLDVHLRDYMMSDPDIPGPHFSQAKTEVGISRQFYFIGLLNGINLGSDPRDEVFLNTNIRNINLNLRHWIAPKWSLQTGLYASALDASLDISVFFPATAEDLEILTNTEYQEVADQGGRSEEPSLMISLIDPPPIAEGDEIFFAANVDLELRAIQLPLMLHRHWYKRRVEYMLGAGLTFEYVTAKQAGENFELGINGMPVDAIITEMPIASKYYDTSIYFEAGTKYHFTNNINLGATLRISVTDPVFSGVDMGLYYRW